MELKFRNVRTAPRQGGGFNRTFMELKFSSFFRRTSNITVLIVPLWN